MEDYKYLFKVIPSPDHVQNTKIMFYIVLSCAGGSCWERGCGEDLPGQEIHTGHVPSWPGRHHRGGLHDQNC